VKNPSRLVWVSLVIALSWGRQAPATSEKSPAPPVEALVAAALEGSPSLAALRARVAAARERIAPAGALPDPMVELMVQNVGFSDWTVGGMEMSMVSGEYRQGLPYPGKRRARREAAAAAAEVATAELEAMRRELVAAVRATYAALYALDRELEALETASELLDLLSETATSRYAVGEGDMEAVLKAQLEVSRLAERSDDLSAQRAATVATLNRLLDRPGGAPLGEVRGLPPTSLAVASLEEAVVAGSAEIAARKALVEEARRRTEVAELDLRPDLFVAGGAGYRGGLDPTVTLRLGAELPLWRKTRQEPILSAARRELEAAEAELEDAAATARATAARLAAEWWRSERQITRYREGIVPQSSAAVDAARAGYLAGRGDFSTVVEDFRLWLDARVALARREAERFVTWAEVQALLAPTSAGVEGATP